MVSSRCAPAARARKSRLTVTARIGVADRCYMARLGLAQACRRFSNSNHCESRRTRRTFICDSTSDWAQAHYQIGIDTYRRNLGDTRLPHTGSPAPVGLEFVLDLGGPGASQLLVDHPYNPYRALAIPGSKPPATQYVYNPALRIVANNLGEWDSVVAVPNRRRIGRDGKIYPAISYNRNRLLYSRESDNSLADWVANATTGVIEVRLPWGMLQLVDPSTRSVLFSNTSAGKVSGATTDGFRFVVESYDPSNPHPAADNLPRGTGTSKFAAPPTWSWPQWENPQWYAEIKPLFSAMQRTFAGIPEHPPAR